MKNNVFLFLFSAFCLLFSTWLMFHTFSYDQNSQSMDIARKCWSDFGNHIPLIRSFSMGGNFERITRLKLPEYPIFPGEPIRYHFIFYMIVGLLEKIGLRIDWALNIPSIIGFAGLLLLIFFLAIILFNNYAIALISVLFFLFNGSLSFLKFFRTYPLSLETPWQIITTTQFTSFAPWGGGVISAFWNLNIYTNQRHLAAGFALGLGFVTLLLFLEKKSRKKQLPFLLISVPLLSVLPYFHQPMLIIIGLFMAWYFFVFANLRIFLLLTGLCSVGPILLQLASLGGTSAFAWYPGYLIHGNLTFTSFVLYWFHNLGLHLILIPIGFLIAPLKVKKVVFPIFVLFLIANLFQFSVEIAANHKFFNFFMIFGNMLSAYTLIQLWQVMTGGTRWSASLRTVEPCTSPSTDGRHRVNARNITDRMGDTSEGSCKRPEYRNCNENPEKPNRAMSVVRRLARRVFGLRNEDVCGTRSWQDPYEDIGRGKTRGRTRLLLKTIVFLSCCLIILSLTLSGIIDFFVVYNDTTIPIPDIPRNEIATWIAKNTPKSTVILNTSYLYNPASIAGRSIFLGWPYFPWSSGYKENRMPIMKVMYESKDPAVYCPLFKKYNISYITVEAVSGNPDLPEIDPMYFQTIASPLFSTHNGLYTLYSVESLCPQP